MGFPIYECRILIDHKQKPKRSIIVFFSLNIGWYILPLLGANWEARNNTFEGLLSLGFLSEGEHATIRQVAIRVIGFIMISNLLLDQQRESWPSSTDLL